jgi:3-oxoacyl-[acyl-carrier-protein] synthase II
LSRRVVVTGLGLVTPLGIGVDETWTALCKGQSGISEITRFDASAFDTKIAGEVKNFHPKDFLSKKRPNVPSYSSPMLLQHPVWPWKIPD